MTILEKYNRASGYMHDIRPAVTSLYSDYLQLPEGKLLSSKHKDRVLVWLNNMNDGDVENSEEAVSAAAVVSSTRWSIEGVDISKRTVTLLSVDDAELWMEDFPVLDINQLTSFQQLYDSGDQVLVDMDSINKSLTLIVPS